MQINIQDIAKQQGLPGSDIPEENALGHFLINLLNIIYPFAILLVFFNILYAAYQWINSQGKADEIQKTKKRITNSVIGLFLLVISIALFKLIQFIMGVNYLNIN